MKRNDVAATQEVVACLTCLNVSRLKVKLRNIESHMYENMYVRLNFNIVYHYFIINIALNIAI